MKQSYEWFFFSLFLWLLLALGFSFGFLQGHSIYLAIADDPAIRFSYYPWLFFSAQQFRQGFFPLWCGYEGTGFPLLANLQSSPFNPFNIIFYIIPSMRLLDFIVLFKLYLAGLFVFLFARKLGRTPYASALSSICFAFSGYFVKHLNQININTELWLGLSLLLFEKTVNEKATLKRILSLSVIFSLAFIGGNPEAGFYFAFFNLLYVITAISGSNSLFRNLSYLCFVSTFAFMLCLFQYLPFIEYLGAGWHIHSPSLHTISKAPLSTIFSLSMPWLKGPYKSHPFQLFMLPYLGVIGILFFSLAIVQHKNFKRREFFFLFYFLVFLGVIYRIPPFNWINYLPIFSRIASVKFAYPSVIFCFSMLAGYGADELLLKKIKPRRFSFALALCTGIIIAMAVIGLFAPSLPSGYFRDGLIEPLVMFVIISFLCLWIILSGENKFGTLLPFLAGIYLISLIPGYRFLTNIEPAKWQFPAPDTPPYLERIIPYSRSSRVLGLYGAFHHNFNILHRIKDLRVFEGLYPESYVKMMGEIEGFSMEQSIENFFSHGWSFDVREENLEHLFLDFLGVKFLISPKPISSSGWNLIDQKNGYYIYENKEAYPLAFITEREKINLDQPIPKTGSVTVIEEAQESLRLELSIPEKAMLVIAETYFPGWKAFDEGKGKELKIEKIAGISKGVKLTPGIQKLRFIYRPSGFRIGLWASLSSLVSFFVSLFLRKVVKFSPSVLKLF